MKVVGYGRCSTAEQASNGVSIEVQRRAVERVAQSNGWEMTWARPRTALPAICTARPGAQNFFTWGRKWAKQIGWLIEEGISGDAA